MKNKRQISYTTVLCITRILLLIMAFCCGYAFAKFTTFGLSEGYYHVTPHKVGIIK